MSHDATADGLLAEYDQNLSTYDAFRCSVEGLLAELVRLDGIRVHSITSRTKLRESFADKIAREGKDGYEALCDITDIIGLRVITHIEDEVDLVGALIEREFKVDAENTVDKRQALDPDRFGYLSLHYVCSLNETRSLLAENRRFSGLKIEVQVRSILQHAWAEIEHDLGYKTGSTIPKALRRRFSRLAGLLEIADDEFRRLRDELSTYATEVRQTIINSPSSVTLDDVSLEQFIVSNPTLRQIDEAMAEFIGRELHKKPVERLAAQLNYAGIETIEDLSIALDKYKDVVLSQWRARLVADKARKGVIGFGIGLYHLFQVILVAQGGQAKLREGFRHFNISDRKSNQDPSKSPARAIEAELTKLTP